MKKLLSVIMAVLMMSGAIVFAENDEDKAVAAVNRYDIMVGDTDGNFRGQDGVTRAEMAKIILACLDIKDCGKTETEFSDVSSSHWASGYISRAYADGIIAGMGDGTFAPDSSVTYEQAVKMLVCALGYDDMAKNMGGYPDGYWRVANNIGVLEKFSVVPTGNATRIDIAKMVYNSLEIPFAAVSDMSPDGVTYSVMDESSGREAKTIMSFFEE